MTYFTFLVMPFVIGLSVFGLEILKVFTRSAEYWEAYKIIPVISFSILFGMMKDNAIIGLQIMKRTKVIGIVISVVAMLNLVLNIVMIPAWGIMGAAIATLISQIIFFAAILLTLSIYAKSFKEAQSIITPLNFMVIIPAFIGLMPGIKLNSVTALIPVLNVSLASKEILAGTISTGLLLETYLSLFVLAGISLYFCAQWFKREDIIFRF